MNVRSGHALAATDDIVLVKDPDTVLNKLPMGRVTSVLPSEDGLVRKAHVRTTASGEPLLRPVTKLILLIGAEESQYFEENLRWGSVTVHHPLTLPPFPLEQSQMNHV